MQRDVKVGLVLGVLLVAVVAVVFFRRGDDERDKFIKLLPAPEAVADRAREALGPSPSDPYAVAPEYLTESWQSQAANKAAHTPTPPRGKQSDPNSREEGSDNPDKSPAAKVVLQPPEFAAPRTTARTKPDAKNPGKSTGTEVSIHSAGPREYTIQEGDTLSGIASHFLGDPSLYSMIYETNSGVLSDPERIPVGQKIRIPELPNSERRQPATSVAPPAKNSRVPSTGRVHEVQERETLTQIARDTYGKWSMFREIFEANKDQLTSPGDIRPGMVLRLPDVRDE